MKKIFFISDTHFFDKYIIRYERRPFESVDEMDNQMIARWNRVVSEDDIVFHLGDVAAPDTCENAIKQILANLNGNKTLIMGNHDMHRTPKEWIDLGFNVVSPYPIIYDGLFILSHEPVYVSGNSPIVNLYGHVHGNNMYKDYSENSFCCCVERIDYTPIKYSHVKDSIISCMN